eukprot:m.1119034 g.1119034  ORF g.1119034 m.1119034 type:complete len:85 (-) comp24389_c0_seq2:1591-1845(-)
MACISSLLNAGWCLQCAAASCEEQEEAIPREDAEIICGCGAFCALDIYTTFKQRSHNVCAVEPSAEETGTAAFIFYKIHSPPLK